MDAPVPATILLVDDLPQNLVAIEATIARDDLILLRAASGPEALELVLKHDIALALIDVQMPGMDGFELAELMRGAERSRNIPIIFMTAGSNDPARQFRGYEAGAVDFMAKPFDPYVLRSKIEVFAQLHTQKRRLAEKLTELEESLRLNEMFTAVLGHDLRSPLSSVLANAEILRRTAPNDRVATLATRIGASGDRMARMISQILDLARVRAQSFRLKLGPADLFAVCEAIRDELEPTGGSDRLQLERIGHTTSVFDSDRMAQLLTNLIGNALQHGSPDEPVLVRVDGSDPDRVTLSVRNRGRISDATLPVLFQPFRGGSDATRGPEQGLGLGLHIVRHLVGLHGGTVTATSQDPDHTVFRVVLPRTP